MSGEINAATPRTSVILAIFEPIALPMARAGLPPYEAKPATIISGADVPKPTIVSPMINGGTSKFLAVAAAPMIKRSALQISKIKPEIMAMLSTNIGNEHGLLGFIIMGDFRWVKSRRMML